MLIIDNYDSFTYNIVEYLRELGVEPRVFKNDEISVNDLKSMDFSSIIISPGPKNPDKAGISMAVIEEFYKTRKILGVCLGHQCLAQFFGAKIIRDSEPFHGKVSQITVNQSSILYKNLPEKFNVTRYHSLLVDENTLPECLLINAKTSNGLIMGIEHKTLPLWGVQYHPEAILTEYGHEIFLNFINS